MSEEKKVLNEEQLTKIAGGEGSGSQIRDDVTSVLEDILTTSASFFTPERENRYPDVERLHQSIENAILASDYSYRRVQVHRAVLATESLINFEPFPSDQILYDIKNKLLKVWEMIKK